MQLPNLREAQIRAAMPGIEDISAPLEGGQKLVFPCTLSGQRCAIKFMLANPAASGTDGEDATHEELDEVTARARREVEIMAQCRNPHIVRLGPVPITTANIGGQNIIYFTEEWIDGRDVKTIIQNDGPLPLEDVVKLGEHMAEAVGVLWSHKKIHRDIKPGNIMRREETVDFVLLDMGVAFDVDAESLTSTGVVPGTLIYFSPEQMEFASKRQMDFRSDLFSLGTVLYEAATARHPFWQAGLSRRDVLARILGYAVDAPSVHREEIPPQMDAVILRLLAKRPHLRYRTCAQVASALQAIPLDVGGP